MNLILQQVKEIFRRWSAASYMVELLKTVAHTILTLWTVPVLVHVWVWVHMPGDQSVQLRNATSGHNHPFHYRTKNHIIWSDYTIIYMGRGGRVIIPMNDGSISWTRQTFNKVFSRLLNILEWTIDFKLKSEFALHFEWEMKIWHELWVETNHHPSTYHGCHAPFSLWQVEIWYCPTDHCCLVHLWSWYPGGWHFTMLYVDCPLMSCFFCCFYCNICLIVIFVEL